MDSLVRFGARHTRTFAAVVLAATLLLGAGLPRLHVETGVLGWLPASHPNVEAFRQVFQSLGGAVHQELVWLELDPEKARRAKVASITALPSLQAQEEFAEYVRSRVPAVRGVFGVLPLMELLEHTRRGHSPGAPYTLPETADETDLLWGILRRAADDLVGALVAKDGTGTVLSFVLDAPRDAAGERAAGQALQQAIASYRNDPQRRHDLFVDRFLVPAGLASGAATIDASLRRDITRLTPVAALFIGGLLFLVLADWRAVLLLGGGLAAGLVWTLGLIGWAGSSLNIISVAILPLILGCGINYGLLVSLEAIDRRGQGASRSEALSEIGRSSATAIVLTTLTTVAGLLTLCLSGSPGMVQLGLQAAFGMAGLAFLSVLVLPGLVVRLPCRRRSWFGPVVAPVATSLTRNRSVVLLVYTIATGAALTMARKPVFLLDVIQGNYPADAPIHGAMERLREKCGGTFPEIVIATGDLGAPGAFGRLDEVLDRLEKPESIGASFRLVSATDVLGLHALIEGRNLLQVGAALAGIGGDVRRAAPRRPEAVREAVAAMRQDPIWGPISGMFIDPELRVATVLLLGGDAGRSLDSVRATWTKLSNALDRAQRPGDPIKLSFLGYRTMSYLFVTHSLEWIRNIAIVSFAVVLLLTAIVLRNPRAVLVMAVLLSTSSLFWFGALQILGIHISLFLLFPLVFAVCVGSDYALHILCRLRADRQRLREEGRDPGTAGDLEWTYSAWASTGRAVALAALTDGGVFLIYSRMEMVSASQVMLAVALAVATIFICTVVLVPSLLFPKTAARSHADRPPVDAHEP